MEKSQGLNYIMPEKQKGLSSFYSSYLSQSPIKIGLILGCGENAMCLEIKKKNVILVNLTHINKTQTLNI